MSGLLLVALALASALLPFFWCCCAPPGCARIKLSEVCGRTVTITKDGVTYPFTTTIGGLPATDPLPSGTYTWTATAINACMNDATGTVTITCPQGDVTLVPSVSPVAGYHVQAGCPCCTVVPDCLTMTVTNQDFFHNATIEWQTVPAGLASLNLGSMGMLSNSTYIDDNGDTFRYYLFCSSGYFNLTRVYEASVFGVFRDIVRYRWSPTATCTHGTNTCCPFYMVCGELFSGGDPTERLTLEEC